MTVIAPFLITNTEGDTLAAFATEQERDEALLTGEYPDDAEPAFLSEGPPGPFDGMPAVDTTGYAFGPPRG